MRTAGTKPHSHPDSNLGSRDPYILENEGTGFALCWQGQPNIKIGFESETAELVQVTSEKMLILIPKWVVIRSLFR